MTVLESRRDLGYAVREGRRLQAAREITVSAGSPLFARAWDRFQDQQGLELSFVDCAVRAAAGTGDAEAVATFDAGMREAAHRPAVPDLR